MKLREDTNMKKTFYAFVLLALCSTLGFAADSALHQAHRANAFGIMNGEETDPEAMRSRSGLDFDTQNPVAVHDNGNKGPTKNYTYTKADGTSKKVKFDPNIPQPSEAVDATNEEETTTNSSTSNKNGQAPEKKPVNNYQNTPTRPDMTTKTPPAPQGNTQAQTSSTGNTQANAATKLQQKTYQYLKPEEQNLPTAKKDQLEKSRKQAAEREARHKMWKEKREAQEKAEKEDEEWVDPLTKAKTQEEVREILKKQNLTPELKQVLKEYGVSEDEFIDRMIAGNKQYQRSDYKPKQPQPAQDTTNKQENKQPAQNNTADEEYQIPMTQGMRALLAVKGINPANLKMANNKPVNNQVQNTKKFKLAADIIKADKRLSEKEKQELLEWNDKILRQAEELKEKERQEKERLEKQKAEEERKNKEFDEKLKRLAAEVKEGDLKYGNFNQICDPKIKNSSSEACAMCCFHPQLSLPGFDPKIHQMINGYIDSRTDGCYCRWQGKPLTGYDTRNTSNEACNAYCLAHPSDIKGFNPEKHQVHYGELKKGQCKCHYIDKNMDICLYKLINKTDGACARCCVERPINNSCAGGFDPARHNMWGGYTTKYGGCRCEFHYKPGIGEHPRATVMGKHKAALLADSSDTLYVQAVCNPKTLHKDQVECMKCCLAKTPSAPASGYVFDYGFLNNGECRCHFKNTNKVDDVCDNDNKLQSNWACYECCKAQPPAGFDPSIHEMENGYVEGNDCKCSWKELPSSGGSCSYGPYELPAEACEQCVDKSPRSQWDCEKCCNYIPRSGLYSAQYLTSSPAPGMSAGCYCHYSDGKGYYF